MSESAGERLERSSGDSLGDTLRWALETRMDPSMAAADWLARDIDPRLPSAVELLTRPDIELEKLVQAKDAYKAMRIEGESSGDRRLGARLYAAAIASALVHHRCRISRQSGQAVVRALNGLVDDTKMPPPLRNLARNALQELENAPG